VKAAIQSEPLDTRVLASWLVLACIAAVGVLGIGAILVVEASDLAITNTPYKSRSLLYRSLYSNGPLAAGAPRMWIVQLALKRPYTFLVLALFIAISGSLAAVRTPIDIFPSINIREVEPSLSGHDDRCRNPALAFLYPPLH
jgi:hypothetical protein